MSLGCSPESEVVVEQGGEGAEAGQHNALPCAVVKPNSQGLGACFLIGQVQPEVGPAPRLQSASGSVGKREGGEWTIAEPPAKPCHRRLCKVEPLSALHCGAHQYDFLLASRTYCGSLLALCSVFACGWLCVVWTILNTQMWIMHQI